MVSESKKKAPAEASSPGGVPRLLSFVVIWAIVMLGRDMLVPPPSRDAKNATTAALQKEEKIPVAPPKVVGTEDEEFFEVKSPPVRTPRNTHSVLVKLCTS